MINLSHYSHHIYGGSRYGSVFQKYGERWLKKTEKKLPALRREPTKRRVIQISANLSFSEYLRLTFPENGTSISVERGSLQAVLTRL